jgi:hypothetical protein
VAKYDVDRFIHVSSYNANPASTSEFYATKVRCMLGELGGFGLFFSVCVGRC